MCYIIYAQMFIPSWLRMLIYTATIYQFRVNYKDIAIRPTPLLPLHLLKSDPIELCTRRVALGQSTIKLNSL